MFAFHHIDVITNSFVLADFKHKDNGFNWFNPSGCCWGCYHSRQWHLSFLILMEKKNQVTTLYYSPVKVPGLLQAWPSEVFVISVRCRIGGNVWALAELKNPELEWMRGDNVLLLSPWGWWRLWWRLGEAGVKWPRAESTEKIHSEFVLCSPAFLRKAIDLRSNVYSAT